MIKISTACPVSVAKQRWCSRGATFPVQVHRRHAHRRAAPAAAPEQAADGASTSGREAPHRDRDPRQTPWAFGAQTNERLLAWDESAQAQLMRIWLCGQLGIEQAELEERLMALANLLPDAVSKLHALRAPLVLGMLQDLPGTAARLLTLRAVLPGADVSAAVARAPELLMLTPIEEIEAAAGRLSAGLPGVAVGPLVQREPMLLRADVEALKAEVQRLMPGKDPVAFIAADPGALLDMEALGLPSTLEHN